MPAAEHVGAKQAATERPERSHDLFIARDLDDSRTAQRVGGVIMVARKCRVSSNEVASIPAVTSQAGVFWIEMSSPSISQRVAWSTRNVSDVWKEHSQ